MGSDVQYQVVARTHMNFAGNLVDPAPPGENRQLASKPMTHELAEREAIEWRRICQDRWRVTIEPAPTKGPNDER